MTLAALGLARFNPLSRGVVIQTLVFLPRRITSDLILAHLSAQLYQPCEPQGEHPPNPCNFAMGALDAASPDRIPTHGNAPVHSISPFANGISFDAKSFTARSGCTLERGATRNDIHFAVGEGTYIFCELE